MKIYTLFNVNKLFCKVITKNWISCILKLLFRRLPFKVTSLCPFNNFCLDYFFQKNILTIKWCFKRQYLKKIPGARKCDRIRKKHPRGSKYQRVNNPIHSQKKTQTRRNESLSRKKSSQVIIWKGDTSDQKTESPPWRTVNIFYRSRTNSDWKLNSYQKFFSSLDSIKFRKMA